MAKKDAKTSVVAFKIERKLADFLGKLPNKSEFIRRAIESQLGIVCPVCQGAGSVSKEMHDQLAAFLEKWELHHCKGCGDEFALPRDSVEPTGPKKRSAKPKTADPDYCYTCFPNSSSRRR